MPHSNLPAILAALELAPAGLTQAEIRRITGFSVASIHRHIRRLYEGGDAHIAGWKTDQFKSIFQARYKLGPGQDIPKPSPLTPKEVRERYMARVRSQAGALAEFRASRAEREKRRYWAAKPARRDPMIAALFGSPAMREETSHA